MRRTSCRTSSWRLWRRPEAYDPRRGGLGHYLRLMARSRALDLRRETAAAGRMTDRLARSSAPPPALEHADRAGVRAALRALPPAQREALVLAYWGELTADEVARRADVPVGTAKSRIRLGLRRMRREYAT